MAGYTPLYGSIVTSSIWNEDDKTRIVWITMLALADATGKVEGSVSGLAPVARVSLESCKKAIDRLKQPDQHSRTKEYEGRRIKEIDEGWQILNYEKFREKAKKRTAEYYRNYRLKHKTQTHTQTHTQTGATERNPKEVAQPLQKQIDIELSELLFSLILERKTDFKKPDIQRWAVHVDRMIRLDKRAPEQIEAVIRWCQKDDFWQNNILSAQKLRKQFDQLELKMTPSGETMEEQMARLRKAGKI